MTLFDPPTCQCGDPCVIGWVHRADRPCFLWIDDAPDLDHLGRFQQHSATSRRAALDVYPHTGTQRARVLAFLKQHPVTGATDEEIGLALAMNPSSVRPRRIELVEGGWVRAKVDHAGAEVERTTRSGSMAQVWEASRKAREYVA